MSPNNQNPTAKPPAVPAEGSGETVGIPLLQPICPYCSRALPGMNILSMELPTPHGGMLWLLPSCPFGAANEEGLAVDGRGTVVDGKPACGKILGVQWTGQYTPPKIARPGSPGWA